MKNPSSSLRLLTAIVQNPDLNASQAYNRITKYFVGIQFASFEKHFDLMRAESEKKDELQRTNAFQKALKNEEDVLKHLTASGFSLVMTEKLVSMSAELDALRATVAEYATVTSPKTGRKASNA
jgi:hypothetical protein